MAEFFPDLLDGFLNTDFLLKVCRKFHYEKDQVTELAEVAKEMLPQMRREAFWECREWEFVAGKNDQKETSNNRYEDVVMSLGGGLDGLQEDYQKRGLLSESYMLEALASELLLAGYGAYNRCIKENGDWHVARYHFLGSEKDFPLDMVPVLLKEFDCPLICNDAFCIIPKKSVVFVAELTQDAQAYCESICTGCHNVNCPNRVEDDLLRRRLMAKMADLPLSYGYSRILGRPY